MLKHKYYPSKAGHLSAVLLVASLAAGGSVSAQEAADQEDEVFELSPFTIEGDSNQGYRATSTLAGTRFRTDLADVGSSISVLTEEFLTDVGATDNETVLAYATNAEVGGPRGNFSGGVTGGSVSRENGLFASPNSNTRVRGLNSADNTRNYFSTDVPWDGYTVNRVDLLRGPNSILFGLGSPSGVVNATTKGATFGKDSGKATVAFDKFNSIRTTFEYNKVLMENELAVYFAVLRDDAKFRQDPTYEEDERLFGAIKYAPKSLNSDSTSFEVNASYESGSIESNRPRTLTPADQMTTFWNPISRRSNTDNTVYTAETYPGYPGGLGGRTVNQFYEPDNFLDSVAAVNTAPGVLVSQFMNGPQFQYNSLSDVSVNTGSITTQFGAYASDGSIVPNGPLPAGVRASIWGDNFRRQGMTNTSSWATYTGQYGSGGGFWENQAISDPTIFDFYNKLLEGPNKKEWSDWDVMEASISHTFLNGKIGYNLALFDQKLSSGQYGIMGWESRIGIDINEGVEWNSPNAGGPNGPTLIANPNLGRAYVQEVLHNTGNGTNVSNRDAFRAQAFANYDFTENSEGLLSRILGSHTFTGLYSEESRYNDSRRMNMALLTPEDYAKYGNGIGEASFRYYISDDLRGQNSAAGSNLSNISEYIIPSSGPFTFRMFDTTWNATGVSPTDLWADPDGLRDDVTYEFQASNPANYVGWTDNQATLVTFVDGGTVGGMSARDYLTNNATLSDFNVKSNVLVWQGKFFNDSIIGLYGYREDESTSSRFDAENANPAGSTLPSRDDVRPSTYNLNNPGTNSYDLDTETSNWSATVHLNRLLGNPDYLPFKLSLYYNEGENFQPAAGRLDAFGNALPAPAGKTEETSIMLETKDGKYSLRATDYKTVVTNQNTTGDIGAMWALQQSIFAPVQTDARFVAGTWSTDSHPDSARLTGTIIPAWHQFIEDLQTEFPLFTETWVTRGTISPASLDANVERPSGHRFTEDAVSEGMEFEFTANPTDSWRIAVNMSKTQALRDNVPGESFLALAEFVDNAIMNTPAGEMPIFWSASPGVRINRYPTFRGDYLKLKALNGQLQPEIREWRANLVTNYSFKNGRFDGLGLGGAIRWEDSAAVDYLPSAEDSNLPDITTPVMDDGYETFDLWASYRLKLSDKVDWRIQLNLYNVFGENELVPLSTDPFGNANRWRIREGSSWKLSNTFSF